MSEEKIIAELIKILENSNTPMTLNEVLQSLSEPISISDLSDVMWHLIARGIVDLTSESKIILSNKRSLSV